MEKTKKSLYLTKNQKIILDIFKNSPLNNKFYWSGGTLLAHYYLQHRKSLDLDFFTDKKFSYHELLEFLQAVKKSFSKYKIEENKIHDRWEFLLKNGETLRFEFVYYNGDKKRLMPLRRYLGINIDSLEDMAANKVMAYFDRNQPKDLFDIYFLLQNKFSVNKLIKLTEEKFGFRFSEFMFWSEGVKSLKLLTSLKPLMLEKDEKKQEELIVKISDYFLKKGANYLSHRLSDS